MATPWTDAEVMAASRLVELALAEDLDLVGDITSGLTIPPETCGRAAVNVRRAGVIAGLPVLPLVASAVDPALMVTLIAADGDAAAPGQVIAEIAGPMRGILAAERTALNFLQRLSGVATLTRRYVEAAGAALVLDTRKTTPGWRILEKYAVRIGGGHNHRIGLYDGVLIKDNHLAALGGGPNAIRTAVAAARSNAAGLPVEVEVDSIGEFEAALDARPDIVLLDNMNAAQMKRCVARRNLVAPDVKLEASGGVSLETIGDIAATGVDRISVGALTHSAPALDIALDYRTGSDGSGSPPIG